MDCGKDRDSSANSNDRDIALDVLASVLCRLGEYTTRFGELGANSEEAMNEYKIDKENGSPG